MTSIKSAKIAAIKPNDSYKQPKELLFSTAGRPYEHINSVQKHGLEHKIEDKLNVLSEKMPKSTFKALVAGAAPLWLPTYVLARAGATAAQFVKQPFTAAYYKRSGPGEVIIKLITAPVVSVVGGAGGAIGGAAYGVHRGTKILATSMKKS